MSRTGPVGAGSTRSADRSPIPAIVAASGRSSRMGASKALLKAGGETFLARVVNALRRGGAEPVLVVLRQPDGPDAREVVRSGGLPLVNPDPSPGPIASLQTGLRHLPPGVPGVLFTPVDHPLFEPRTVMTLITAFLDSLPPIASPTWSGRSGHPVLFNRSLFPELLEEYLPEGARSVVQRYHQHRLLVPVDDPGILADIDTREDYRRHFPRETDPIPKTRP